MAANVREWTASKFRDYHALEPPDHLTEEEWEAKTRGWYMALGNSRGYGEPRSLESSVPWDASHADPDIGFRCAK